MTDLRDYQAKAVEEIEQATGPHVLFTLPTGGGKTVIADKIAENAVARGERVLILTHPPRDPESNLTQPVTQQAGSRSYPGGTKRRPRPADPDREHSNILGALHAHR